MNWAASRARGHAERPSRRWWVVTIVLLLIGSGCLGIALHERQHPLAEPAPPPPTATSAARFAPPSAAGAATATAPPVVSAAAARSVPVTLRIPAIGVSVSVSELGLNPDGTVQVPTNFQQPGWFRLGPTPGELGSAVILGHVDSHQGPAVFYRLRSLRAGDRVEVTLADGVIAHFAVNTVIMYPKKQFPARQVYAPHGYRALQLVTCGGTFDTHTHHYLSNIVAYTTLVATTPVAGTTEAAAGPASQKKAAPARYGR
jgi:sortase (surface protein transpeptidase)